jgi:predicted acetyltransferase
MRAMTFLEGFNHLEDDCIYLEIIEKNEGNREELPYYYYVIYLQSGIQIGKISIRIGHNKHSYYNGNIGYEIYPEHRGKKHSLRACKLVLEVARAHGMNFLYICCAENNVPSRKIIESPGAKLQEIKVPPKDYIYYYEGMPAQRIYRLDLLIRCNVCIIMV